MTRRAFLLILGLAAAIAGGALIYVVLQDRTEGALEAAVEPMIRDLEASGWSKPAFDRYAADELKQWFTEHNKNNGMPELSVLGAMKAYQGLRTYTVNGDAAMVVAGTVFDVGETFFDLRLVRRDGRWQMLAITVDSPSLADK